MELPYSQEADDFSEELIITIEKEMAPHPYSGSHRCDRYLEELSERYSEKDVMVLLSGTAELIEPVDRDLGQDSDFPAANAFYRGGLIALRIAEGVLGEDFSEKIAECKLEIADPSSDDEFEEFHQVASGLADIGAIGYEDAGAYRDFIEEIEDEICPDIRMQSYMRRGFGLIMHQMHKYLEIKQAKEVAAREQELEGELTEVDWNKELSKLLEEY